MWLYPNFGLKLNVLIKVFALFSMSNNIAKIICTFVLIIRQFFIRKHSKYSRVLRELPCKN